LGERGFRQERSEELVREGLNYRAFVNRFGMPCGEEATLARGLGLEDQLRERGGVLVKAQAGR